MNIRSFAVVVLSTIALSAVGCVSENPEPEETEEAAATLASKLNGKYKFVFDDARRGTMVADLQKRFSGEELAAAKRELDDEADVSVLEFRDGRFISWIGDKAIADGSYEVEVVGPDTLTISMNGKSTQLAFAHDDTIVISDPQKGELTFERVK